MPGPWVNVPGATGLDIEDYVWARQFPQACRERAQAIGQQFWPRTNQIWDNGTVHTLVDNHDGTHTLTDNADGFYIPTGANRWFGFSDPSNPQIPPNYDLIIDDLDETKVVRSPILGSTVVGSTQTYLLDTASLNAYVVSKQIPSIASLLGKNLYVLRSQGVWWSDRWIEWPNELEQYKSAATSSSVTSITDTSANWSPHQWAPASGTNYELMISGQRIAIIDNTVNTITFAALGAAPSGSYAIVVAGKRWRPGDSAPYKAWYRGSWILYFTRMPTDITQGTKQVRTSVTVSDGPPSCSSSTTYQIMDADVFSDPNNYCHTPIEECFNIDLFKTWRGYQLFCETVCRYFVDKNLVYDNATSIPLFVPATFFKRANIGLSYTTTVSALSADGITIPAQTFPNLNNYPIWYATLDAAGNVASEGLGTITSTSDIAGSFVLGDVGRTVVLSYGWTRWNPLEMRYMFYPKQNFIPSISTGAMGDPPSGQAVDPPTSTSPGLWKIRPKSTTYKVHSPTGVVLEGLDTPQAGDLARDGGDDWNDPTIHDPLIAVGDDTTLMSYQDNAYTGWHDPTHALLDSMPSGFTTGGTTTQLQDTAAHWWGSVMSTNTGTADSGSGVSLGDSTKGTDGRWNAATGRWLGFVVEIQIAGIWYRRPITLFSGTTISWSEALPGGASANGKAYRIREPGMGSASVVGYELNRYMGRTLILQDPSPGGLTYTIPILYSDDNTLYFAAQAFTIGVNWPYTITENKPNFVWQWDAVHSKWIVPTGIDARTGLPFLPDQTANLPTKHRDFGKCMKGDYFGPHIPQELYQAFQQLVWTTGPIVWDPEMIDGTPVNNGKHASDLSYNSYASCETWYTFAWNNAPDSGTDPSQNSYSATVGSASGPPYAYATTTRAGDNLPGGSAYSWLLAGDRVYCYGVVNPPTYMSCSVDYYVYGTIDAADSAPSATNTFDNNGDTIALHLWKKFATTGVSNAAQRKTPAFGNSALPVPNPPGEPATSPGTTANGYYAHDQLAIYKWDGVGGMTFV